MKKNINENNPVIIPAEPEQVSYWTKRWGITKEQLNEAILETGSIRIIELKNYLKSKPFVFTLTNLIRRFRLSF
jgi:hypothetical protein